MTSRQRAELALSSAELLRTVHSLIVRTVARTRPASVPDPVLRLAVSLEALRNSTFAGPPPGRLSFGCAAAESLQRCHEFLNAGSDLLDTHLGRHGAWRSPDAGVVLDPAVSAERLRPAIDALAAAAAVMSAALLPFLSESRRDDFEVSWSRMCADLTAARTAPVDDARLRDLVVAHPNQAGAPPVVRDLALRLRCRAWRLLDCTSPSASTMADLATAGALLARVGGAPAASRAGWNAVVVLLGGLRTPACADVGVRSEVTMLRDAVIGASTLPPGSEEVVRASVDIARWLRRVLDQAETREQLYLDARVLSGDEVSDEPVLARAKLRQTVVALPAVRARAIRAAFDQIAAP